MDESGGTLIEAPASSSIITRKRRSSIPRRPRPEIQLFLESYDPLTPTSNDAFRVSSEETDVSSGGKMFSLNQCISRGSPTTIAESDHPNKKIKDDQGSRVSYSNGGVGDDAHHELNPTRQLGTTQNGIGSDNKLKKVKLKVGGVTRTIQAKDNPHGTSGDGSSSKGSRPSDTFRPRQKLTIQDNSGEGNSFSDKKTHYPTKDVSRGVIDSNREGNRKTSTKNTAKDSDSVRKSKRVPKRRVLDGAFDEDEEEDDEIRYLEKLKTSKVFGVRDFEEEPANKHRSLSRVSKSVEEIGGSTKDCKKRSFDKSSEDTDYEAEEEVLLSDGEREAKKKQKQRRDSPPNMQTESKREIALTTRQRALLSGKEPSAGVSQVEFPNGLPPPPSRKQKEKLTEVEQQLKKTEAAHRRRMQNEKAARESEAEAIRKILGQDSNRKKKEDKVKKRQEELAQEKAAKHQVLASETVRIVMKPTGTIVTFPMEMGLPPLFGSKPCSYPPPREKCAGPSCLNPYKYRDSKSKLPLCSLNCYKAIHSQMDAEKVC
ncbi:unnamed protein product [Cuscuta epithymum]|uniref:INO80 complex subunit B-like conserved region domain-containing protein n=1 Tax=Cuscuta epithymum TaxID=186058 RepID=A0AAV0FAR4_9ASTE|nr:unnamed protein product [Cuscuta epithymum]CAH9132575.1 unnamed protein product [Cuscuta epithymum]